MLTAESKNILESDNRQRGSGRTGKIKHVGGNTRGESECLEGDFHTVIVVFDNRDERWVKSKTDF